MSKQILVALLIFPILGLCQNPEAKRTNIWYFGNGAGLDFSSGSPVAITDGALHSYEGGGVMCDLEGNLLFYTDGDTVWNRLHQPMPNGTGLFGCGNYGSSAQNGLIVPKPGSETVYYIFTNDCFENFCENGLRYTLVDMSLDAGYGDVTEKNILMLQPSTEALAATKHANGVDYWIMGHEYNTNRFFCYLLNQNGVAVQPVISEIGLVINSYITSIKFSNKGDMLAMAFDNISTIDQLFEFDAQVGSLVTMLSLSNIEVIPTGMAYSVAFSPDDSKLYFMTSGSYIYQYCLSGEFTAEAISSTVTMAGFHPDNSAFGQLQMGLDSKIYISSQYNDSISTIEFPNQYGLSSGVQVRNIYLAGRQSLLGLPSFVSSLLYDQTLIPEDCDTTISVDETSPKNGFSVFPNPFIDVIQIDFITSKKGTIVLYDNIGQKILESHFDGKKVDIEIPSCSPGLYHLIIETSEKERFKKTVIILNR